MGGGSATYDYGFRIYNPQIARFLSVDPLSNKFAYYTPYQFAGNNPIAFIDLDGLERAHPKSQNKKNADRLKKQTAIEIAKRQQNQQPNLTIIPKADTDKTKRKSELTGLNFLDGDQKNSEAPRKEREPFEVNRDIKSDFVGDENNLRALHNIFEGSEDIPKGGEVESATLTLKIEVLEGSLPQNVRIKQGNFGISAPGEETPLSTGDIILERKGQTGTYETTIELGKLDPKTSFSVEYDGGGGNRNVKVTGQINLKGTKPKE